MALSDWIGVSSVLDARGRRSAGRSTLQPPSVADLAWSSDPLLSAPDVRGCLRVAAKLATRLLPLAYKHEAPCDSTAAPIMLRKALAAWESDLESRKEVETSSLGLVAALCDEVLNLRWPAADPREGMWTYVASLASHAAERAARPHDEDRALAEVEF